MELPRESSSLEEILNNAELACQRCDYDNALSLYTLVISRDSGNWNHYIERSMVNIYLRKYEDALYDSEISVKINPRNFKVFRKCL